MPVPSRALTRTLFAVLFALGCAFGTPEVVRANPVGEEVVAGAAAVVRSSAAKTDIFQASARAVIEWQEFDIQEGEHTEFHQPSADAIALNRILSQNPSSILGRLSANGQVILVNPNGVFFGKNSTVDAHGLVVSAHDIDNNDFMAGHYAFTKTGRADAAIILEGRVTASDAGIAAFVAPAVANSGIIEARLGRVALAAAEGFVLDLYGDGLIAFPAGSEVKKVAKGKDGKAVAALVDNSGNIYADGGSVLITASAARGLIENAVSISGTVAARGATVSGGKIVLHGGKSGAVHIKKGAVVDASGTAGGSVSVSGESILADGSILARGTAGTGGRISLDASSWLSLGGAADASGVSGGVIDIQTGGLAFSGSLLSTGAGGAGGRISLAALGKVWDYQGARVDVSGSEGGSISWTAGQQVTSSAAYCAIGLDGAGGRIDMTAPAVKLLSAHLDASGSAGGGTVRVGGEYQGGKNLTQDEIANASIVAVSDGTRLLADATGVSGNGGTVIVWSDENTAFFGSISAKPGTLAGNGGFAEVSTGGDRFAWNGTIETGRGTRQGAVLLDPKNIEIKDVPLTPLQLVLGFNYGNTTIGSLLNIVDTFGASISLDGARLAVGAPNDAGSGNVLLGSGAVHLFTFTDADSFAGATLAGTIGAGYTGGKNVNMAGVLDGGFSGGDSFGFAVSLDGNRLAASAPQDDGSGNGINSSGAVHLFTFTDSAFSGGALAATIGSGYTGHGGADVSLGLFQSDAFGKSVSLDGARLAVGATGDDGQGIDTLLAGGQQGAIYLFTFASASGFAGGSLAAVMGSGYTGNGGRDINLSLDSADVFGSSVSLDGNRLAAGATGDGGFGNASTTSGAVRLFTFTNAAFNGGALAGTIGSGYAGAGDINLSSVLENGEGFGSSVSLDGNRLAVGTGGDDGFGDAAPNSGAVHMFTFTNAAFSGGARAGTIGYGYAGAGDINLSSSLDIGDVFGASVSLDGDRLAVGAAGDDGFGNTSFNSGAAYLFDLSGTGTGTVAGASFGNSPADSQVIARASLLALLNAGQAVTLQANNDITLSDDLLVSNAGGDGGALTLQAGRSILLNGSIFSDNGAVTLRANENAAAGVVSAQRDSGSAVLSMADGTSIDAGTGAVLLSLGDGIGNAERETGDISLRDVSGGEITIQHLGDGGDVVLNGQILRNVDSAALSIAAVNGRFINLHGADVFNDVTGRFLIYTSALNTEADLNGISAAPWYNQSYAFNDPAGSSVPGAGDRFVYALGPQLTVTANDASRIYGDANPAFAATVTGFINGDDPLEAVSGEGSVSTSADEFSNVGNYLLAADIGTLASAYNYGFAFANGTLAVTPAPLNIAANDVSREYGEVNPVLTGTVAGLRNGDTIDTSFATDGDQFSDIGGYIIAPSATGNLGNYDVTFTDGTLSVYPALLTVTADDASRLYGDANPALTGTVSGIKNGDALDVAFTTPADEFSNIGDYVISTGVTGAKFGNYIPVLSDATLTVTPAPLTVTADAASRVYGDGNPAFTGTVTGLKNEDSADGVFTSSADAFSGIGDYDIIAGVNGDGLENYEVILSNALLTITPAPLTVTADAASRVYGDGNPAFTGTVTGLKNEDSADGVFTTAADEFSGIGDYDIIAGVTGDNLANYEVILSNALLTVTPAPLTVTADAASRVYGDSNPAFTGTVTGLKNEDSADGVFTSAADEFSNIGDYDIVAAVTGDNLANYEVTLSNALLTVTPAPLTVAADDAFRFFGFPGGPLTGQVTGVKNGDLITALYTTLAGLFAPPGFYDITPSASGAALANYDVTLENGLLFVFAPPPCCGDEGPGNEQPPEEPGPEPEEPVIVAGTESNIIQQQEPGSPLLIDNRLDARLIVDRSAPGAADFALISPAAGEKDCDTTDGAECP